MRDSTVGAKNMASSSGCAIRRQMRLFSRRGKDRVKGEEEVEEKVQNMKTALIATATAVQLNGVDIVVFNWGGLFARIVWRFPGVPRLVVPFLRVFRVGSRIDLGWGYGLCCSIRLFLGLW